MKKSAAGLVFSLTLALGCSGGSAGATLMKGAAPPKPAPVHRYRLAPADEYFGRLKMSVLEIANHLKDFGLKIDADPVNGEVIFPLASFTEDSIRDWQRQYPADPWLPRTVFALERVYAKIPSDAGRARALRATKWLLAYYPGSPYARISRAEYAAGTVGYPSPAPAPAPTPGATPSNEPPAPAPSPGPH